MIKMKNLFLIGLVTLFIGCNKLNYTVTSLDDKFDLITYEGDSIKVDKNVTDLTVEFIRGAKNHDYKLHKVDSIVYSDTLRGIAGVTLVDYNGVPGTYILLNEVLKSHPLEHNMTLYHELGHGMLNKFHCHSMCRDIMSSTVGRHSRVGNWEIKKKRFFENTDHKYIFY